MFITDKSNKHHKPDTINKLRLAYRTIVRFVTGHVYSLTDPVYVEQISTLSSNSTWCTSSSSLFMFLSFTQIISARARLCCWSLDWLVIFRFWPCSSLTFYCRLSMSLQQKTVRKAIGTWEPKQQKLNITDNLTLISRNGHLNFPMEYLSILDVTADKKHTNREKKKIEK